MLIIGHRGAAGLAPENTLEALRAGVSAGADILEFDVRMTSDNIPILSHGSRLHDLTIRKTSYDEMVKAGDVTTLESVLEEFFGEILLNLQLKPVKDVNVVYKMLTKYIKKTKDWDNILISSFHVRDLSRLRRKSADINLALLHSVNPFAFVTYNRRLQLAAVGWHRLHVNNLAIAIAHKAGIFSYVYTVNRPEAALLLDRRGIDAIVTDFPDRITSEI